MRAKTALWALPLVVFATGAWNTNCFSQSEFGLAPQSVQVPGADNNSGQVFLASISPNSIVLLDPPKDPLLSDGAENAAPADPGPAPKGPGKNTSSHVGIGIKFSTLGAGIEAAVPLTGKLNLRGGFNIFRYGRGITNNGINYNGNLHFQSGEAHLDWFPFSGFHVSPGLLFYNGNNVTATAAVPGGQTFSLGGTQYESDPAAPVSGTGTLDFVKVSPSIMVGVGNLIPRNGRHYSFLFEVGGAYQGSARVALNFAGNVCDPTGTICRSIASDPTVQANIQAQQLKIKNDINPYRFFPVLSFGVGFNF
jgi:hypothetical protein